MDAARLDYLPGFDIILHGLIGLTYGFIFVFISRLISSPLVYFWLCGGEVYAPMLVTSLGIFFMGDVFTEASNLSAIG